MIVASTSPQDSGDFSLAWERALLSAKDGDTILIPPGNYDTSRPIDVSRPVTVLAVGVTIKARRSAAVVTSAPRATIVGLEALGGGRLNNQSSGFELRARSRLVWCTARNFGRDGFSLIGDVNKEPPTSVSISQLIGCESTGHGGRAFVAQAGDANACVFLGCTTSDCMGEWAGRLQTERRVAGFHDQSFLGSYFIGCHSGVHDKDTPEAERALGYCAIKPGSRGVIVACYQEMSNETLVSDNNVAAWMVGPTAAESTGGVFRGGSILGKFTFDAGALFGTVKPKWIFGPNRLDGYLAEIRSVLDTHAFAIVRDTTGFGAGYWAIRQRNSDAGDVVRVLADSKRNLAPELWFPLNAFIGPGRKPLTDAWMETIEARLAALENKS